MTEWQILWKVEVPLGLPLLIGGICAPRRCRSSRPSRSPPTSTLGGLGLYILRASRCGGSTRCSALRSSLSRSRSSSTDCSPCCSTSSSRAVSPPGDPKTSARRHPDVARWWDLPSKTRKGRTCSQLGTRAGSRLAQSRSGWHWPCQGAHRVIRWTPVRDRVRQRDDHRRLAGVLLERDHRRDLRAGARERRLHGRAQVPDRPARRVPARARKRRGRPVPRVHGQPAPVLRPRHHGDHL